MKIWLDLKYIYRAVLFETGRHYKPQHMLTFGGIEYGQKRSAAEEK